MPDDSIKLCPEVDKRLSDKLDVELETHGQVFAHQRDPMGALASYLCLLLLVMSSRSILPLSPLCLIKRLKSAFVIAPSRKAFIKKPPAVDQASQRAAAFRSTKADLEKKLADVERQLIIAVKVFDDRVPQK